MKFLKNFQAKMRKRFARAKNREVKLMLSSLIVLVLSVAYAADRILLAPALGAKAAFKPDEGPILVIMAVLILASTMIMLYFGTRYR